MSYYDGFTPVYTFRLSIDREDRELLDVIITAKGEAEDIGKAKRSIRRLLEEHTPKIRPAAVPTAEIDPEQEGPDEDPPEPEELPEEPVDGPVTTFATTFNAGIKGLVFLECPVCGNKFHACLKDYQTGIPCKCGHMIDLTDPTIARFEYNCPSCGRHTYGKTNIEGAEYTDTCQCGEIIKLRWSKLDRQYMGVTPEDRQ